MSRDRIKKLLGMTAARGCTEAEAMAAAEKAAKLMAEMGLREGDIEFDQGDYRITTGWGSVRSRLWTAIATATNTAPITRRVDGQEVITFVGHAPGPEIATYLFEVTDRAINRALREFRSTTWYRRRRTQRAKTIASNDFLRGMVTRLATRLLELFGTSRDPALLTAAQAELEQRFPNTVTVPPRPTSSRYYDAALAGALSGDVVTLARGVGQDGQPLMIGGGS